MKRQSLRISGRINRMEELEQAKKEVKGGEERDPGFAEDVQSDLNRIWKENHEPWR